MNKTNYLIIIFSISIFLSGMSFGIVALNFWSSSDGSQENLQDYNSSEFHRTNSTYEGLEDSEVQYFKEIFDQINPIYLMEDFNFLIVKDISEHCDDCTGLTYIKKKLIVIEFKQREHYLKNILSHEIMHIYFTDDGGDLPRHKIIYDLGFKEVVFS